MKPNLVEALLTAFAAGALGAFPACGGISEYHDDPSGQSGTGAVSGTSSATGGRSSSVSTGGTTSAGGSTTSAGGGTTSVGGTTGAIFGTGGTGVGGTGVGNTGGTGTGGTGGTGVIGGSGGDGCGADGNRVLVPSPTGWVDYADFCNDVGVQGTWYSYGDQYGSGPRSQSCLVQGGHLPSECAYVKTPDPNNFGFPNVQGNMHTAGVAEQILPCLAGSAAATIPTSGCPGDGLGGGADYSNMWGAGIGFDFNDENTRTGLVRSPWSPLAYGVIGIAFTIKGAPYALRVEFPMVLTAEEAAADFPPITSDMPTTDDHSVGAPYWGALAHGDGIFPNSPVVEGVNVVLWDSVSAPKANAYVFDVSRMLGVRFHVPTSVAAGTGYDFTISNLTFLRHL